MNIWVVCVQSCDIENNDVINSLRHVGIWGFCLFVYHGQFFIVCRFQSLVGDRENADGGNSVTCVFMVKAGVV